MAKGIKRMEMVGDYEIRHFKEGNGAAFTANSAVILSSGELQVHTAAVTDKQSLVGLAVRGATGTRGTMIPVMVFRPNSKVRASVYHVTPASAVATSADIGKHIPITLVNGKSVVSIADAVAPNHADASKCAFIIIGLEGNDDTERYRRVICAVKPQHCALFGEYSTEA